MNKKQKLLVISMYLIVAYVVFMYDVLDTPYFVEENISAFLGAAMLLCPFLLLVVVVALVNIISNFWGMKKGKESKPHYMICKQAAVCKLVLVPWYITNFVFWAVFVPIAIVIPGLQMLLLLVPIAIVSTALTLLATSSLNIAAIVQMRRMSLLSKGTAVLHIILQLMFVTDVIDAVYLWRKYRKMESQVI